MRTLPATLDGSGLAIAVVASRFNHPITLRLVDGACARLSELGCESVDVCWVPGAFELPLAAQAAAATGRYRAIVALGVVIRGETPHFEYVCQGVTDGCQRVALDWRLPVAFGVLTTDTAPQALARAAKPGEAGANKGAEAAEVAVEMARLLESAVRGA